MAYFLRDSNGPGKGCVMKDFYDKDEEARITQAIQEMKAAAGDSFSMEKLNLSELERRCGVTRMRLRRLKKNNFQFKPHGNTGKLSPQRKMNGHTGILDSLLKDGITNSVVCLERLQAAGFPGGISAVKDYITAHKDLGAFPWWSLFVSFSVILCW